MVNPRMAVTSAAISIIALSSLAVGGAGMAGASSREVPGTPAARPTHVLAKHVVCRQHMAILRQMRRSGNEYVATTATYRALLISARKSGQIGLAGYWANVMTQRHAHQVQDRANLAARKAQYQAADQISGAC